MQTGSGLSEQRVVYNPLGNPTRVSWSDGSALTRYWEGLWLRGIRDARERIVWFDDNLQQDLGRAALLNRIRIGGERDDPNSGFLFAELVYDRLGRFQGVKSGNNVGVRYTYGVRGQLRSLRYDGDQAAEQFTYSCCGEPQGGACVHPRLGRGTYCRDEYADHRHGSRSARASAPLSLRRCGTPDPHLLQ